MTVTSDETNTDRSQMGDGLAVRRDRGPQAPRRRLTPSTWLVAVGDQVGFQLGVLFVGLLRFAVDPPERGFTEYLGAAPVLSVALLVIFLAFDLYRTPDMPLRGAVLALARPLFLTAVLAIILAFFLRGFAFPRIIIGLGAPLGCLLVLSWRVLLHRIVARRRGVEKVMVIVDRRAEDMGDQAATLKRLLNTDERYVELSQVVDHHSHDELLAATNVADLAIIASAVPADVRSRLAFELLDAGLRVLVMPAPFDVVLATGRQTNFHALEGVELVPDPPRLVHRTFKRLLDVLVAAVVLVLAVPFTIGTALAVRLDSPGPVIFSQTRVGLNGATFRIHKFRTMRPDAEADTGAVFASVDDPRITRVGGFLRRSRLDEIPQLWNVLRGDMSLVGPRPERPEFVAGFARDVTAYAQRHVVRPGITGLAQVRAGYSATVEEKLRFDLLYINRSTLLDDVRILVQTLATILDFNAAQGVTAADAEVLALLAPPAGDE